MKRIITLMLALGLVFGAVANSSATDISAKGYIMMYGGWQDNANLTDEDSEDDFYMMDRLRAQIDFTASENLKGVAYFEIDHSWGNGGSMGRTSGGAIGADGVNIETKQLYIDWDVPSTDLSFRMGIQGVSLPSEVFGSSVLSNDVAAIVANYDVNEMIDFTAFWARPKNGGNDDATYDADGNVTNNANIADETDLFAAVLGVNLDGVKLVPWAMYGAIADSDSDADDAYFVGLSVAVDMFDPITIGFDGVYSDVDGDDSEDSKGFILAAAVDYKMDNMTPGIFGWYASGDDDDEGMYEGQLANLGGNDGFCPDLRGGMAFANQQNGQPGARILSDGGTGLWAIGAQVADIKVIEDLTSSIQFMYLQGTNDEDQTSGINPKDRGAYLTEDDSAWQISVANTYKIYEQLSLMVDASYLDVDFEDDIEEEEAASSLNVVLKYSF